MSHPAIPQSAERQRPAVRVPIDRPSLEIHLRADPKGPVVAREEVLPQDLAPMIQEAWLEGRLRRGSMSASADGIPAKLLLIPDKDSPTRCLGFAIELPGAGGGTVRSVFSFLSLTETAQRAIQRIGKPSKEDAVTYYHYDLHMHFRQASPKLPAQDDSGLLMDVSVIRSPLQYLGTPLAPLLEQARESTPFPDLLLQKNPFPVFYTKEVFELAEEYSRKGAATNTQFESGAMLAGCLCSCPDSGELFVVVLAAFEVQKADQALLSLAYSGESWADIQRALRARQKTQPFFRLLGQAHGHNYVPDDSATAAKPSSRASQTVSNLFASAEDQNWSRAVFSHQPWHLCHIFGLTSRCDRIDGLFTLRDGRLSHRTYHLLRNFHPEAYPILTAPSGPLNS